MAIGKVGSFATVEPAIVDFGGMAKGAIDSVKEDRERKRREQEAAKLKKQQDIEKIGGLGFLKSTNTKAFNQGIDAIYREMKEEFAIASSNGDTAKMKELQNNIFSINNTIENVVKQQDFYLKNEDKFDPKFIDRNKQILENIDIANMDVSRGEGGRVEFTVYKDNDKKEPLFERMTINEIQDSLEVPYAFNEDAVIKDFKKNFPLDEIESLLPNQISTTKVSELKSDSRVKEAIDRKANILANDNKAMAWYGANFLDKFEANSRGFTDEEKKKAQDYFATTLQQSYNKEVDLKIKEKTGRGEEDVIQLSTTQLISPISLQRQGAPKIEGLRTNFIQGSKLNTKVGEATILGVFYDEKNNKLYSIRSEGASASAGVSSQGARGGTSTGSAEAPYLSEDLNKGQADISSLISGLKLKPPTREELINVIRKNYNQPQAQQTKDETPEQRLNRLKKEIDVK